MGNLETSFSGPRGLSFSIADLILVGAWAEALDLRMEVLLDHGTELEEYEEVLVFHAEANRPCRYIVWRDAGSVFVQPLIGRIRRYDSIVEAILALTPSRDVIVTDVMALDWPDRRKAH